MKFPEVALRLLDWVESFLPDPDVTYPTVKDRMRLVIGLVRSSVDHGTRGPFGAAIFDLPTNRLVAPGVNLVATSCAVSHAEMVTIKMVVIMTAQRMVGTSTSAGRGNRPHELVTSAEPCAMCLGAISWSGVRRLVCGARGEDAEKIGFDEGPKPAEWVRMLEDRGISVVRDELRDEAAPVLRRYTEEGGVIYNGCQGDRPG